MSELFGCTRAVVTSRYALITPEGLAVTQLPGWKDCAVQVGISPRLMGPRFTQLQVGFGAEGLGEGNTGASEYFVYVLEGAGSIGLVDKRHRLDSGSFVYLPPGTDLQFKSNGPHFKLLIFQKLYEPHAGVQRPTVLVGHQKEVKAQPHPGNPDVRVQGLLPDNASFDLAVSLWTHPPGAALPSVETPIVEQGGVMLKGQGICRLADGYHPVCAGDTIWSAAYCPRWFVAMGRTPATFILYRGVNRDPM